MKNFFTSLLWLVVLGLVGYNGYLYYKKLTPCTSPITYTIGTIDPKFGVSKEQFVTNIAEASSIWNKAYGLPLFVYNETKGIPVNLEYDSRQQITQQETVLHSSINQTQEVANSIKKQYVDLQNSYRTAEESYSALVTTFNQAQTAYNKEVDYWNSKGGAPAQEYAALQTQKEALVVKRNALEQTRLEVNSAANQINALIDKYNLLVGHINETVDTINNDGLAGTEFEEGVYISDAKGKRITIFQFDSHTTFVRVLAHELGHALGLEHVSGTESIMSPVNEGKKLTLSKEDLQALRVLCKVQS